ncbi:hypothetical protein F4561_002536 [Lipingzhangella halophila]|uniref:Uncharacterized protein n=1 Tax=Lipingzhangella halophila TaxID=1783352 RepID=A0A7W7RGT2_9ACTN|nr:hypothetical protein [Lipingzhangella halophila]
MGVGWGCEYRVVPPETHHDAEVQERIGPRLTLPRVAERRARERDESAIARWVAHEWPRIKRGP